MTSYHYTAKLQPWCAVRKEEERQLRPNRGRLPEECRTALIRERGPIRPARDLMSTLASVAAGGLTKLLCWRLNEDAALFKGAFECEAGQPSEPGSADGCGQRRFARQLGHHC